MAPRRDTDADWINISLVEPLHGILTAPQFLNENLTDERVEEFFASGEADVDNIVSRIEWVLRGKFSPRRALDFGCGVGRLVFPMRKYADHVIGVDVSQHMLARAEQRRQQLNATGIEFQQDIPAPQTVDWINSYLVLQHIPPERGYGLISHLLASLRSGGVASVHFTAYREQAHLRASDIEDIGLFRFDGEALHVIEPAKDLPVGRMRMFDLDLGTVLPLFVSAGIESLRIDHVDHGGHHAFWVFGQKTA